MNSLLIETNVSKGLKKCPKDELYNKSIGSLIHIFSKASYKKAIQLTLAPLISCYNIEKERNGNRFEY